MEYDTAIIIALIGHLKLYYLKKLKSFDIGSRSAIFRVKSVINLNEKLFILCIDGDTLNLKIVSPNNSDEISKLKRLNSKGLTKLLVIDTSYSYIFHQNNIQKLIDNLSTKDNSVTELIDCTPHNHGLVQIGAANIWHRKLSLSEQAFKTKNREEKRARVRLKKGDLNLISMLTNLRKRVRLGYRLMMSRG